MNNMTYDNINFKDILLIIKKRFKLIIAITTIATVLVTIINFYFISPVYRTETKLFIGKEVKSSQSYNDDDIEMYQRLMKTYSELILTKDLIKDAIKEKDLNIDVESVIKKIKVNQSTDSQILEITYENSDKAITKDLLESIINQFIKQSNKLIPNGTVQVVENVELPEEPVSPNKYLNIAIAFILSLIGGIVLASFDEYLHDTVNTQEELENLLSIPVIGVIPNEERRKSK